MNVEQLYQQKETLEAEADILFKNLNKKLKSDPVVLQFEQQIKEHKDVWDQLCQARKIHHDDMTARLNTFRYYHERQFREGQTVITTEDLSKHDSYCQQITALKHIIKKLIKDEREYEVQYRMANGLEEMLKLQKDCIMAIHTINQN